MRSARESILRAAVTVLVRGGPTALTLEQVAQEAAISKGGLLYHFPGKEPLIAGLVDWVIADLGESKPDTLPRLEGHEIGSILVAAMGTNPSLLDPLRAEFRKRPATADHLAAEGLWLREALDLAPPTPQLKKSLLQQLRSFSRKGSTARQDYVEMVTAIPVAPAAMFEAAQEDVRQLCADISRTVDVSAASLLGLQTSGGFWQGDLKADTTLESDYIMFLYWLGETDSPRIAKAARTIVERQLPDGAWNIYPGGPAEVNATIRAYVALRMAGVPHDLGRVRQRILEMGGLQAANSYTKINLSLLDLFPSQFTPSVPPEIVIVPGGLLYEMSSWTRTIVVPLSIVQASGVRRPIPINLDELYVPDVKLCLPKRDKVSRVFNQVDRILKLWERRGLKEVRAKAMREAEKWMLDHMRFSDGIGAIYPSMMYALMAMDALGYERDHPDFVETRQQFEALILETDTHLDFQPAVSPVWDTAIAMFALGESGQANQASMRVAADWLIQKEVRRKGDWAVKRPALQPSGWAFEFANEFYPDIDDTAMVLLALEHAQASDPVRQENTERRAINWLLGMQSSDGGWAAFDVDNNWQVLSKVPFADHNAMLDPTCPDITGRVLEALCRRGFSREDARIAQAVDYLLTHQREDGSWYGRWGVNYVYGTFLALRGLRASGLEPDHPAVRKAVNWLLSVQNADGGWGEDCASYVVHAFVPAASTPSQTAWALLGLAAAGCSTITAVTRGIKWLTERRNAAGAWDETLMTGTGFPNVFYLSYGLYSHYFPLLALGIWEKRLVSSETVAEIQMLASA